jgi:DNA-binding transcriptional ArsR family regulator
MHAFEVLGDPVRRRILELIAEDERSSGAVSAAIQKEFGITQPAVSQHLRVLREAGFATVRPDGARRLYAVSPEALRDVDAWLDRFRRTWTPHLDALATEVARGKRKRQLAGPGAELDQRPAQDTRPNTLTQGNDKYPGARHDRS